MTQRELLQAQVELAEAAFSGQISIRPEPIRRTRYASADHWATTIRGREWKRRYNREYNRRVRAELNRRRVADGIPSRYRYPPGWEHLTKLETKRLCMRRARAEAKGLPVDQYPPRVRRLKGR